MDIQRLLDNPSEQLSQCLRKLAPRGWNTNTQFFLIFLAILGLHLWLLPALMRSAGVKEPGDPQGYFTSGPETAEAGESRNSSSSPEASPASTDPAPAEKSEAPGSAEEALVLSDSATVATPVKEAIGAETPESSEPEQEDARPLTAVALASDPAADLLDDSESLDAVDLGENPVKEVAEAAPVVANPVAESSSEDSAKTRSQATPVDRPEPKLSDLVTEAKASKPEPTPGTGEGPRARSFRSLR